MNVTNKAETENELLSRKEIVYTIEFEGATPTKDAVKELLVKGGSNADLTIVKDVIVAFKTTTATCMVYEYTNANDMKRIEVLQMHKKIEEKMKVAEEAKAKAAEEAKAAPAEEKAEEAPAEEKSEEAPVEEKKEDAPAEAKEE